MRRLKDDYSELYKTVTTLAQCQHNLSIHLPPRDVSWNVSKQNEQIWPMTDKTKTVKLVLISGLVQHTYARQFLLFHIWTTDEMNEFLHRSSLSLQPDSPCWRNPVIFRVFAVLVTFFLTYLSINISYKAWTLFLSHGYYGLNFNWNYPMTYQNIKPNSLNSYHKYHMMWLRVWEDIFSD